MVTTTAFERWMKDSVISLLPQIEVVTTPRNLGMLRQRPMDEVPLRGRASTAADDVSLGRRPTAPLTN